MPTIVPDIGENEGQWVNPIGALNVEEFMDCTKSLDPMSDKAYMTAEHLCEASRAILFQLPRLTLSQADELITIFKKSIERIGKIQLSDQEQMQLVSAFAEHIQKRVDILIEAKQQM